MESIRIEKYKQYNIQIVYDDEMYDSQYIDGDCIFIASFHRKFYVVPEGKTESDIKEIASSGKYWVFPLEAYIHSGVTLSLLYEGKFPDRQWDVSQCGYIFVFKDAAKTKQKALKIAKKHIKIWNSFLRGEVYGYVIEKNGVHYDSCFGFIGDLEYCLSEAKSIIDCVAKQEQEIIGACFC